jgi:hypothetical protein
MRSRRYDEIDVALTGLEAAWKQARVLLWEACAGEVRLVGTHRCRDTDVEAALATWRTKWRRLQAGAVVHMPDATYHPVRTPDGELLGFVQSVGGASVNAEAPEVQGYVEFQLGALAVALAGPASDPTPELHDVAALAAAAAQRVGTPARAPALMVLATDDADDTVRAKTVAALARCGWNASEAARYLGITRQTVWRRMKRHAIPRPEPSPFDSRASRG